MRPSRRLALLVVAFAAATRILGAQQTPDPVMPRAGSWGAEAVLSTGVGANVLRFTSPTSAWLAGLSFSLTHQTDDMSAFPGGTNQSGWVGFTAARLGRRWWSGDRGERIRPLAGLGVLGGLSSGVGFQSWNAGGYGELGATYFYSPHVSIGAAGELTAVYSRDRSLGGGPARVTTRWTLGGTLIRVNAGVYF